MLAAAQSSRISLSPQMHTQVAKDAAVQDEAVGEKWLRTLF